jgi:hypothetical protein
MSKFIVSDYFAERAKLKFQKFEVDDVEFVLMALSDEHDEDIKSCMSSAEMLDLASNFGIAYNRERVSDNAELSKDFDKLWEKSALKDIRHEVGEKVFEISDLTPVLKEMQESERVEALKKQGHINGDMDTPVVMIDQLNDDEAVA